MASASARLRRLLRKRTRTIGAVSALSVAALLLLVTVTVRTRAERTPPLDDFDAAPRFALIDQDGRPVETEALRGKVVLINFIYTNCQDICPLLSVTMKAIQERLRDEGLLGSAALLFSITVDPERDTPDVLREYGAARGADLEVWRFLTGPKLAVVSLVIDGFHLGVDVLPPASPAANPPAGYTVAHGTRFVLIDRESRVRAYYPGADLNPERVLRDIRRLAR